MGPPVVALALWPGLEVTSDRRQAPHEAGTPDRESRPLCQYHARIVQLRHVIGARAGDGTKRELRGPEYAVAQRIYRRFGRAASGTMPGAVSATLLNGALSRDFAALCAVLR